MKAPIIGRCRRIMISTDGITGTQPLPFKRIL
jgi:hypothetical protein